jgi:hypothetical protein
VRNLLSYLPIFIFLCAEVSLLFALLARKDDGELMVQGKYSRGRLGIALSLLTGGAVCLVFNFMIPSNQVLGIALGAVVSGLGAFAAMNDWGEVPVEVEEHLSLTRSDVMVSMVLLFGAALAAAIMAVALQWP